MQFELLVIFYGAVSCMLYSASTQQISISGQLERIHLHRTSHKIIRKSVCSVITSLLCIYSYHIHWK